MNLATMQFYSQALGRHVTYSVLLPAADKLWEQMDTFPLLYQLHGRSDDHTAWLMFSRLASYAADVPFIIVMPDGGVSFWGNFSPSERYEDFIMQDLDTHVRRTFPARPGKAAIGGLSMGGYGAMALGLKHNDAFASVYCHSSAFYDADRFRAFHHPPDDPDAFDLFRIAREAKNCATLPVIGFDCGTEDFLLEYNQRFHKQLSDLDIPHTYTEHPGTHNWAYWDTHVTTALDQHRRVFFPHTATA